MIQAAVPEQLSLHTDWMLLSATKCTRKGKGFTRVPCATLFIIVRVSKSQALYT